MSTSENFTPGVFLESLASSYLYAGSRITHAIYISICLLLILSFLSLFFITMQVSEVAPAIIRPETEWSVIHSLVNGRLAECRVKENSFVEAGQVLYIIESDRLLAQEKFLGNRKAELDLLLNDLHALTSGISGPALSTPLYQQAYRSYREKLSDAQARSAKVKTDYERNRKLHDQKVIADAEFEGHAFEFRKAQNDVSILIQQQVNLWENERTQYMKEEKEISSQLIQLQHDKEDLIIHAPVRGNIQNVAGLYPGSLVFVNQPLGQISPETELVVEAYVQPNNIGLIQHNTHVLFQVDAFNYNQWGVATGTVQEISSDIQLMNEQPIFKVRCNLDNNFLQLRSGYKGYLKKGMTLQARFLVTERTLWQLLYDKADDWLNPYSNNN